MNAHFCFSELLIWREKNDSRIFFWAIGVPKKYRKVAQTKGTILHQAPQNTLFFDSPCIFKKDISSDKKFTLDPWYRYPDIF